MYIYLNIASLLAATPKKKGEGGFFLFGVSTPAVIIRGLLRQTGERGGRGGVDVFIISECKCAQGQSGMIDGSKTAKHHWKPPFFSRAFQVFGP